MNNNPIIRAINNSRPSIGEIIEAHEYLAERVPDEIAKSLGQETSPVELVSIAETLDEAQKLINSDDEMVGLSTGYRAIDAMVCGMRPGDIIIVFADTGMMKSVFVQNISLNVASLGIPVLFIGTELVNEENTERFIRLSSPEHAAGLPIIYPKEKPEFEAVEGLVKAAKAEGAQLVVVDLLQMFETTGENEQAVIRRMCRQLKDMAVKYEVPMIVVSHINADKLRKGVPKLDDILGSSAIKQVATHALALWIDKELEDHQQVLKVVNRKNRRPIKRRKAELTILPNARLADSITADMSMFPTK